MNVIPPNNHQARLTHSISALQNTGTTWVGGNIGTYPGTTITGYPPGTLTGGIYPGISLAQDAQKYCSTTYKKAWTLPVTTTLPTPDLSGLALPPGVYAFPSANVVLNTFLTLNGASNPNGQWVFLIKGNLSTAVNAFVQLVNGAQACNVYFVVNQSAGIGDTNRFQGNVIAVDTIKVGKNTSNYGT